MSCFDLCCGVVIISMLLSIYVIVANMYFYLTQASLVADQVERDEEKKIHSFFL